MRKCWQGKCEEFPCEKFTKGFPWGILLYNVFHEKLYGKFYGKIYGKKILFSVVFCFF